MFSIIIPLYNKEKSVKNTVNSVLKQSVDEFELIIVNDGSTDGSIEIVSEFKDNRIRLINKNNEGVSSARNRGIDEARFEYIAFLDSDDIWTSNHLEEIRNLIIKFDNDSIGGFTTSFKKMHNIDDIIACSSALKNVVSTNNHIINNYFEEQSKPYELLCSSNFVIKKSKVHDVKYKISIKYGEDVEFWHRYFGRPNCILIKSDLITTFYFTGAENRSTKKITPVHQRYSEYDFDGKSLSEKKYLGKLAAIAILDYTLWGEPKIATNFWRRYAKYSKYIFRYFFLLLNKKLIHKI